MPCLTLPRQWPRSTVVVSGEHALPVREARQIAGEDRAAVDYDRLQRFLLQMSMAASAHLQSRDPVYISGDR